MLPTEDASSKSVRDFGIGTYDSYPDSAFPKGEDDESREPRGESLPTGGGSEHPNVEPLISYPQSPSNGKHASLIDSEVESLIAALRSALSQLPGDFDRPVRDQNPAQTTLPDILPTSPVSKSKKDAESQLPKGEPAAHADYYDHTMRDGKSVEDIWPYEDASVYADESQDSLPTPATNDTTMDDFLGALGNAWSGYTVDDLTDNVGFPQNFPDWNENFPKSNDDSLGGTTIYGGSYHHSDASYARFPKGIPMTERIATDLELVGNLSKEFLKEYGKKDLVRRHVLSFLQERNLPQYLASDIIRCLKHREDIIIADAMDLFPISKKASSDSVSLSSIHHRLVDMEIATIADPPVASVFRHAAAAIAKVLAKMERVGS